MRYLITVVHEGPDIDPAAVPAGLYEDMGQLVGRLQADGVLVDGAGLAPIAKAKRVTLRGGRVDVVDGPFAEAREWVGGYFMVQVGSEAEAVDIARESAELHRQHLPGFEVVHEVRQVMEE